MKDSKGLVEIISRILRVKLPAVLIKETEIDQIDFKGKDALNRKRFEEAMLNKGKASILYFQAGYVLRGADWKKLIFKTVNSADRAAGAASMLKLRINVSSEARAAAKAEPYLSELAGNCYIELGDYENACCAYLKSAKAYIIDFENKIKAKELKTLAEALDSTMEINLLERNPGAKKLYDFLEDKLKES